MAHISPGVAKRGAFAAPPFFRAGEDGTRDRRRGLPTPATRVRAARQRAATLAPPARAPAHAFVQHARFPARSPAHPLAKLAGWGRAREWGERVGARAGATPPFARSSGASFVRPRPTRQLPPPLSALAN